MSDELYEKLNSGESAEVVVIPFFSVTNSIIADQLEKIRTVLMANNAHRTLTDFNQKTVQARVDKNAVDELDDLNVVYEIVESS